MLYWHRYLFKQREKKLMKYLYLLIFSILISGCAGAPQKVKINSTFDADQAREQMKPGNNVVKGNALIRQSGGGIVTCAGSEISLLPVNAYSTERVKHIYGSDQKGYSTRSVVFEPKSIEYHATRRTTVCDSQGMFKFDKVKDGDYYVTGGVWWVIGSSSQGGNLMQRVRLSSGVTKEIVLSP